MINTAKISEHLGLTFVSDVEQRRGSVLFKARKGSSVYAVKGYDPEVSDTYDRKSLLRAEAAITREVDSKIEQSLFVDYVTDVTIGNWLLTRWVEGETISAYTRSLSGDRVESLISAFANAADVFCRVHEAGFLHGDVQPSHVVIPQQGELPVLIDWGLARRVGDNTPYSGGFVHFVAPEVAIGMLDKSDAIEYTLAAEIYSFGALMTLCLTGETAAGYQLSEPFEDKLRCVAAGVLRPMSAATDKREAELNSVIASCLAFNPKDRPASMDEIGARLKSILSRGVN